jgi:hypothetical protein
MPDSIEDLKKKAVDSTKRGRPVTFADGNTWVIPTMPLKHKGDRINELANMALAGTLKEDTALVEFVELIVLSNYPDANKEDINPDLESARDTIKQYIGGNLGN